MPVNHEILQKLKEPFLPEEINWRVGATTSDKKKGLALAYIDARAVMDRLDDVCGPENWQRKYLQFGRNYVCEIGINIEDVGWVWKSDGASETEYEATKGGLSDAFKRAAVSWGVGRYLYRLDKVWVPIKLVGNGYDIENPPQLPDWALPTGYYSGLKSKQGNCRNRDTEIRTLCKNEEQKQVVVDFLKFLNKQDLKIRSVNDLDEQQYQELLDLVSNVQKTA